MLVIPLKSTARVDLLKVLGSWLDNDDQQVSFQTLSNPLQLVTPKPDFGSAACHEDLMRLSSLRNCLADGCFLKQDSHSAALEESGLDDAYEYHAALLQFERMGFPTMDDDDNGLVLKWKGAWLSGREETHSSLLWDRACVTFNIVALLSFQASRCNVTDREDCKKAVGFCQQAASILETLQEFACSQNFATVDFSSSTMQFWKTYLLAQGQSFVYRMAASGGSNHSALSGLAQSAYSLYTDALAKAQDARLQSELPLQSKEWATHCKAEAMMAAARAEYHQAALQRLDHKFGIEIVRLRLSLTKLQACRDFISSLRSNKAEAHLIHVVDYTQRECLSILPVVSDRLTEIERDNYKLYNEDIPKSVPEIEPKQLVKLSLGYPAPMLVPKKELFTSLK